MVKVTAPALSLDASGSIAGAMVFSKWKGRNYIRQLVKPANPRSGLQVSMRASFRFLSQQWQNLSAADQATWETLGDQLIASPFNGFMSRNQFRWRNFTTPGKVDPITTTGTVGATPTTSAVGGERQVTISAEFLTANNNWGVGVYRDLTTAFTPSVSNLKHVLLVDTDATAATFIDSPLVPDTYFYNYRPFTDDGVFGAALGEDSAVVT